MLLMVAICYALSYLIPTKQRSIRFPIYSNQAFYIAQSGVEYAVRYSSDMGWRGTTDSGIYDLTHLNDLGVNQRDLGNGRFTINYDNTANVMASTGEINNSTEKRVVRISNYTQFLRLIFDPASQAPCWSQGTRTADFFIQNVRGTDVTLRSFSASWTQTGAARRITRVYIDGDEKYRGNYNNGDPPENFNRGGDSQTITPSQVIQMEILWNGNIQNDANIIITFYTGLLGSGDAYTFNLDPEGNGLPGC
jgi:hypothetical protein